MNFLHECIAPARHYPTSELNTKQLVTLCKYLLVNIFLRYYNYVLLIILTELVRLGVCSERAEGVAATWFHISSFKTQYQGLYLFVRRTHFSLTENLNNVQVIRVSKSAWRARWAGWAGWAGGLIGWSADIKFTDAPYRALLLAPWPVWACTYVH